MRDIVGNIYSQRSLHSIQRWDNCIARLHGMRQVATGRITVAFLGRSGLADACVVEMGRPAGTEACLLKTASNSVTVVLRTPSISERKSWVSGTRSLSM
jgi:hypothetical protein